MIQTIYDAMFGPPIHDRSCGPCTACCLVTSIHAPELTKPEGVLCPNCTGSGCAIYDRRPAVCRDYNCGWKRIGSMPIQTRPDRSGIMVAVQSHLPPRHLFSHLFIAVVLTKDRRDLETPVGQAIVRMLTQHALPIVAFWKTEGFILHPSPQLEEAILNPERQSDHALVRQGREWLERYAPLARGAAREHTNLPFGL